MVGGLGSIGSRYVAILKYLGHESIIYDTKLSDPSTDWPKDFEKAIIAAPTDAHFDFCRMMMEMGKPFLCEKPMSKSLNECLELETLDKNKLGRVVCNYKFITKRPTLYDYFKTGSDGLYWDCSQLIYLNPEIELCTNSPIWTLEENGNNIPYQWLENSYFHMINDFLNNNGENCWTLEDGRMMTEVVLNRMEIDRADINRNPS